MIKIRSTQNYFLQKQDKF